MKLPNPARAIVDIAKLRDYCLNPRHEHGRHKARVFASALGLTAADAGWLRDRLREAAGYDANPIAKTQHGVMYMIEFELRTASGVGTIRSGWFIRKGEDFARLATCYVKRSF